MKSVRRNIWTVVILKTEKVSTSLPELLEKLEKRKWSKRVLNLTKLKNRTNVANAYYCLIKNRMGCMLLSNMTTSYIEVLFVACVTAFSVKSVSRLILHSFHRGFHFFQVPCSEKFQVSCVKCVCSAPFFFYSPDLWSHGCHIDALYLGLPHGTASFLTFFRLKNRPVYKSVLSVTYYWRLKLWKRFLKFDIGGFHRKWLVNFDLNYTLRKARWNILQRLSQIYSILFYQFCSTTFIIKHFTSQLLTLLHYKKVENTHKNLEI